MVVAATAPASVLKAELKPVRTASELFAAVREGVEHIEIWEHISTTDHVVMSAPFPSTIKSIRVCLFLLPAAARIARCRTCPWFTSRSGSFPKCEREFRF
jgi:hypothetical protein